MNSETDNEIERIKTLETIVKELKARVAALETRLTTVEQGLAQKWFQ